MPRDLDLKRRLELAGLVVTEVDGWPTRGKDAFDPTGSVHHHTGGALKGVQPSLGVVINGRSDLPGPLCHVHGPREESLRVNLVAAGKANHAGQGGWDGLTGNSSVWGLEEEHTGGPNESVSELRLDRMARVHAAFLFGTAHSSWSCQHREWAPTRKVDFTAHIIPNPDQFRARIADHLRAMAHPKEHDVSDTKVMVPTGGPDKGRYHQVGDGIRTYLSNEDDLKEAQLLYGPAVPVSERYWANVVIPRTATSMRGLRSLPGDEGGQGQALQQIHDAVVKG